MAKQKEPHPQGFLYEPHTGFQQIGSDFIATVCSELDISEVTYRRWRSRPDLCSNAGKEKILKISSDLVNKLRLQIAGCFKVNNEERGKPEGAPAANS